MKQYERTTYSFFDMAGDIGGFVEFFRVFGFICVSGYSNRMYFASVIQDMYRVRHTTKGANINKLVHWRKRHKQQNKNKIL